MQLYCDCIQIERRQRRCVSGQAGFDLLGIKPLLGVTIKEQPLDNGRDNLQFNHLSLDLKKKKKLNGSLKSLLIPFYRWLLIWIVRFQIGFLVYLENEKDQKSRNQNFVVNMQNNIAFIW